jgi:hypothetical protein
MRCKRLSGLAGTYVPGGSLLFATPEQIVQQSFPSCIHSRKSARLTNDRGRSSIPSILAHPLGSQQRLRSKDQLREHVRSRYLGRKP